MIKKGMVIRDGGWTGVISRVIVDTAVCSPLGAGLGHPLYASKAWPLSAVIETKTGCVIDPSRARSRSPAAPAKARRAAVAEIEREQKIRSTWDRFCTLH
jgi:hypothetical protein